MRYQESIARELTGPTRVLSRGSRGPDVKRVQEWLNFHGYGVKIDSDFGPATEAALKKFDQSGIVDARVWSKLTAKMTDATALFGSKNQPLGEVVVRYAQRHYFNRPKEIGGQNRGPWVRLYMNGNEGDPWAWCAGFVCFLYEQACTDTNKLMPFKKTFSCDELASNAKKAGQLMTVPDPAKIPVGSIFLVEKSPVDWIHTGIVTKVYADHFDTIEGNTNDDGSREGYEVCARTRGFKNNDFIVFP